MFDIHQNFFRQVKNQTDFNSKLSKENAFFPEF